MFVANSGVASDVDVQNIDVKEIMGKNRGYLHLILSMVFIIEYVCLQAGNNLKSTQK